jgi:hypothetical protein
VGEGAEAGAVTTPLLATEGVMAEPEVLEDEPPCCYAETRWRTSTTPTVPSGIWCCTCRSRPFRRASLSLCTA